MKTMLLALSTVLAVSAHAETETLTVGTSRLVLEKGVLSVPENRTEPGSRVLSLPYQRLRAATPNPNRRPLFLFNGGPGASNLTFGLVPQAVWGTRDLIVVGYRGVDGTTVLPDEAFTKALWGVDSDSSEASLRSIAASYSAFVANCRSQGIDIDGYVPDEVVADTDALRALLGYTVIDVYGQSYGTRLCSLYARDYAASTGRVVLSGANPPGHFVVPAQAIDAVVRTYQQREDRDLSALDRVTGAMPERWLFWPIQRGMVKLGAQLLLANPSTAASVFDAYTKADAGDASGLAGFSLLSPFLTSGLHAGDLFFKGMGDADPERDYLAETADPQRIGRAFLRGTFGLGQLLLATDLPARRPSMATPIAAPTLVVNGDLDTQTPLPGVEADMMPLLPQGHLVVLRGYGHFNAVTDQPEAFATLVTRFLDSGTVDPTFPQPKPTKAALDLSLVGWAATGTVSAGIVAVIGSLLWWFLH